MSSHNQKVKKKINPKKKTMKNYRKHNKRRGRKTRRVQVTIARGGIRL